MPAVKSKGKIRITQKDVPLAASTEEMPSSAISEDVSKPRPKRMPIGYIFHGLARRAVSSVALLGSNVRCRCLTDRQA